VEPGGATGEHQPPQGRPRAGGFVSRPAGRAVRRRVSRSPGSEPKGFRPSHRSPRERRRSLAALSFITVTRRSNSATAPSTWRISRSQQPAVGCPPASCPPARSRQSPEATGLGENPRRYEKNATPEGEGRRTGKGLVRIGRREHATHEPLISRAMLAAVPLTGLFLNFRHPTAALARLTAASHRSRRFSCPRHARWESEDGSVLEAASVAAFTRLVAGQ
jgi:hypothetical protein